MAQTQRVWFITGASTGFGRLLAEQVLAKGDKVVATARKPEQIADLTHNHPEAALALSLDVTDETAIEAAVDAAIRQFGRIDVLVNNAGYGLAGAIEEATQDEYMPVFETNVFGLISVTKAILPHLRKQRSGHIVNLSSVGGLIGSPGWGFYNASKFAVEGFSEALAAELSPLGIHVTIVSPAPSAPTSSGVPASKPISASPTTTRPPARRVSTFTSKPANRQAIRRRQPPPSSLQSKPQTRQSTSSSVKLLNDRMTQRLVQWKQELETWRDLSLGADFDTAPDPGSAKAYPSTPEDQ